MYYYLGSLRTSNILIPKMTLVISGLHDMFDLKERYFLDLNVSVFLSFQSSGQVNKVLPGYSLKCLNTNFLQIKDLN